MVAELFDPDPVAPPFTRLDAAARYLWGHRRIFHELVDPCEWWVEVAAPWCGSLTDELEAAAFGSGWDYHDSVVDAPVGPRYRLTEAGLRVCYPASALADVQQFVVSHPNGEWQALLGLWAGGAFTGGGDHRRQDVRRELLACVLGHDGARRVVGRDDVGRDAAGLAAVAPVFAERLGSSDAVGATDAIAVVTSLPRLIAQGLVEERRPRPTVTVAPAHWSQSETFWPEIRYLLKDPTAGMSDDTRQLASWLAERPRMNRRRDVPSGAPATPWGRAELESAWKVQVVLGRLMHAHAYCIWASGSLVSVRGLFVFADGNRFAGNPTSLQNRTSKGASHPAVRKTHRLPDACLWLSGDLPDQPSVFIEYEARRSNLLVAQHVLTALTVSAMWNKPIWMVVVATPDSRRDVVAECDELIGSEALYAQALEWPNADLRLRIVSYRDAVRTSALTGPAIWERRLHLVKGRRSFR